MLNDLESLVSSIWDDGTRAVVEESLRAYNGQAYRSAVLTLWVAVVFDIKEKVKYLADSGDVKAKQTYSQFEIALKKLAENDSRSMQDFEDKSLANCDKHHLISFNARDRITGLKRERNKCAHPSFAGGEELFEPSAELYRMYLVDLTKNMFSRPPVDIDILSADLEEEIRGIAWPHDSVIDQYIHDRYLRYLDVHGQRKIVRVLLENSLGDEISNQNSTTPKTIQIIKQRSRNAIRALMQNDQELTLNVIGYYLSNKDRTHNLANSELLQIVGLYGSEKVFWTQISPTTIMPRLRSLISIENFNLLVDNNLFYYGRFANDEIRTLVARVIHKYVEGLVYSFVHSQSEFDYLIRTTRDPEQFVPSIIYGLQHSQTYYMSSFFLDQLAQCASVLKYTDVADIQNAVLNDQYIANHHQILSNADFPDDIFSIACSNLVTNNTNKSMSDEWLALFGTVIEHIDKLILVENDSEQLSEVKDKLNQKQNKLYGFISKQENDRLKLTDGD